MTLYDIKRILEEGVEIAKGSLSDSERYKILEAVVLTVCSSIEEDPKRFEVDPEDNR